MGKSADSKSHMNQQQKKNLKNLLNLPGQPYLFDVFLNLLSLTLRFNMLTEVHRVWDVVRFFCGFFLLFLWALHDLTIEWICYEVHSREDWVTTPWSSRSAKYKITTIIEVVTHTDNHLIKSRTNVLWSGVDYPLGFLGTCPGAHIHLGARPRGKWKRKDQNCIILNIIKTHIYIFFIIINK